MKCPLRQGHFYVSKQPGRGAEHVHRQGQGQKKVVWGSMEIWKVVNVLVKGSFQALEPHHFFHGGGNAFCEREYLTLEVDYEGVGLPATNHLDGVIRNARLMDRHGTS